VDSEKAKANKQLTTSKSIRVISEIRDFFFVNFVSSCLRGKKNRGKKIRVHL